MSVGMGTVASIDDRTRRLSVADGLSDVNEILNQIDTTELEAAEGRNVVRAADLAHLVRMCDRVVNQVHAVKLAAIAAADRGQAGAGPGAASTSAWVRTTTRADGAVAAGQVALATALDHGLPVTGDALAAGEISTAHASIIADTMTGLPHSLTASERRQIEARLTAAAHTLSPARLRVVARRALAYAGRSTDEVDAAHDEQLRTQEQRAYAAATLTLHDHTDGTTSGRFVIPTLAASILRKTVQHLASPRCNTIPGETRTSDTRTGDAHPAIDWAHRNGVAFTTILEHLPTDHLPTKTAATVIATIPLTKLTSTLGAAGLDTGNEHSASGLRRLACNAGLIPAVFGTRGHVLDLGRTTRLFTDTHRTALATSYTSCAADNCDRPYAWCELHHIKPWHTGGTTALANALPLCSWHHHRIHDPSYKHHISATPANADLPPRPQAPTKTVTFHRRT